MSGFEMSEERLFQSVGVYLLTPPRYVPGRFLKSGHDGLFVHLVY